MLAESKRPDPRFRGEHAPARPRWPAARMRAAPETQSAFSPASDFGVEVFGFGDPSGAARGAVIGESR